MPELARQRADGVIDRSKTRDTPCFPLAAKGRLGVWNSHRGNHLGQRSCASAKTGRTYGRKRSDQSAAQITLRGGGRPHMGSGYSLKPPECRQCAESKPSHYSFMRDATALGQPYDGSTVSRRSTKFLERSASCDCMNWECSAHVAGKSCYRLAWSIFGEPSSPKARSCNCLAENEGSLSLLQMRSRMKIAP